MTAIRTSIIIIRKISSLFTTQFLFVSLSAIFWMEEAFKKLQQDNNNTVDNLIKWMKDSKIVDGEKVTEEKARQMFSDASDASNVEYSKFQEVIGKSAKEHNKSADEFFKSLAAESGKFLKDAIAAASTAASAAANTLTQAFTNK